MLVSNMTVSLLGFCGQGHESRNCPLYQDKDLVYTLVTMQWGEHVDARGGH